MSLDVVVVTYNSAEHLGSALEPLPSGTRVIVVDNASTDGSAEVARRLGAEVVQNPVNAGFAAAANQGVALGDAELVLFLNPDAHIDADTLDRLGRRLDDDPSLAVVAPRLHHDDGREQRVSWPFPSAGGAWREALGLHRLVTGSPDPGFVIGACFLVRRSVFESLGGFDNRFWLYGEEAELCRRARERGWGVALAPELAADHVGGASATDVEDLVVEHFERGGEHIVAKHDGPRALLSYRLANLTGAALRSVLSGPAPRRSLHRRRARRLLTVLRRHPTRVALDSPATRAPGEGLVVCSLEPWDDVWRRNQFLVRELLERDPNRRVLFVEPPYDWLLEARRPSGRRRRRGLSPLESDARIIRLEPGKVWPRVLGGLADRSLRRQVRRAAAELGLCSPTLWVNDPHYAGLATEAGWPALYDITDDWTEAGDGDRAARRVRSDEARLFDECDAVVVCSDGLSASRRAARPDLEVIPNAVDIDHFRRPLPRPIDLPPGSVAVYVGTLHEDRLDLDLLVRLATAQPHLRVVLVGPNSLMEASTRRLESLANIHLLGSRPYAEIPGYLQHADVVIVPHVVSPFTESLDPIKAYECLAVGRPVVATPVAGFRDLPLPVRCASAGAFVDAVAALVGSARIADDPQPVPSWGDRAAEFDAQLPRTHRRAPRIRVVVVDHCAQLSGGEIALLRLVPALRAEGVDVRVILGEHGPLEGRLREAGAAVEVLELDSRVATTRRDEVRLGSAGVARVAAIGRDTLALRRRLRELAPDLVHTNSLKAALYGGAAARLAGVPVVWHIRDRIADDYLPSPAVGFVRAAGSVLPRAIIVNSEATRATLGSVSRRRVDGVTVVHDALPRGGTQGSHLPHDGFRVAMVGRLAPWKGQHIFLEAFARALGGTYARAVVVGSAMFGEQEYEAELHALVARLGIGAQVEFMGFHDDVAGVLAEVDCLVHASVIPEPFGQVVVEGMAAGLPVIASGEGGPAEIITDGVDGVLYAPGDIEGLAGHLGRLSTNPRECQRLGVAARARGLDFAPEMVAGQVRRVYEAVLGW